MWLLSLWVFSSGAIISSILVITSVKTINAIICLILAFINGIGLFVLLGVDFIALIYTIVYVGAIAILFLFVIMLLSSSGQKLYIQNFSKNGDSRFSKVKNVLLNNRPMAMLIGVLYILQVWTGLLTSSINPEYWSLNSHGISSLISRKSCITGLGEMLYKECGYEVLLGISLILLVGMIGSIVLTLTKKNF